ncbi:hypothetical protein BCR44DRAFT_1422290 [Catenaria anguillulae PL171]|uniref:Uncharacterized protein n=1 Tax=Catenaria anguillulae PL171 TaxID=765915 RepID=A0A1Y2I6Q8_9FUNG|nr:hypothetical protein BCR44DRAFT_1422290 [Catenaria anguillulae PL171]
MTATNTDAAVKNTLMTVSKSLRATFGSSMDVRNTGSEASLSPIRNPVMRSYSLASWSRRMDARMDCRCGFFASAWLDSFVSELDCRVVKDGNTISDPLSNSVNSGTNSLPSASNSSVDGCRRLARALVQASSSSAYGTCVSCK